MWPFKVRKKTPPPPELEALGRVLFAQYREAFDAYCVLNATDPHEFRSRYRDALKVLGDEPSRLELLYIFATKEDLVLLIDCRGEENAEEIEAFLETRIGCAIAWTITTALRNAVPEEAQRDGKFIEALFRALDQDLGSIGQRLLFFNLPWDVYVFMPMDEQVHITLVGSAPDHFRGIKEQGSRI